MTKWDVNAKPEKLNKVIKCNPVIRIPREATEVHGITDEMVKDWPLFKNCVEDIRDFISGCDLSGFNAKGFDIPMLWEECFRNGVELDMDGVRCFDSGVIFKKMERRTLAAAVKFYCKEELEDAHNALADTWAAMNVLGAQMLNYPDLGRMSRGELHEFSSHSKQADLSGKIAINEQGVPVFNTFKNKGVPVINDRGYANWMLAADFPENTKQVIRKILGISQSEEQGGLF